MNYTATLEDRENSRFMQKIGKKWENRRKNIFLEHFRKIFYFQYNTNCKFDPFSRYPILYFFSKIFQNVALFFEIIGEMKKKKE